MTTIIPDSFAQFMRLIYKDVGEAWLAQLPELLATCAAQWDIVIDPTPFPNLSYNYVAPAMCRDGRAAVIKIGVPNRELFTEMAAMRWYDGKGAARLLAADEVLAALLLERIEPGEPLTAVVDDAQATGIASKVMAELYSSVPCQHTFPSVADWLAQLQEIRSYFGGSTGPLPEKWVTQAERLAHDLLQSAAEPVLLHGDLHHDNILAGPEGRWVVIDPKGVIGEPAYETARFLHNPIQDFLKRPFVGHLLARRVDIFAERLNLDRQRILGWGFCDVMLGAWWSVEEGDRSGLDYAMACAELFARLL